MARLSVEEQLKDVRRAYVIAQALNVQYVWIREFVNPEIKKAINDAKAANSFFIKQIKDVFEKNRIESQFVLNEEELSYQLLEYLEKLEKLQKEN